MADRQISKMADYLREKLNNLPLDEVFEGFGLDPEEVLLQMHLHGYFDIEEYMDAENLYEDEEDEPEV